MLRCFDIKANDETNFFNYSMLPFSQDPTYLIFNYFVKDYRYRLCGINYRAAYLSTLRYWKQWRPSKARHLIPNGMKDASARNLTKRRARVWRVITSCNPISCQIVTPCRKSPSVFNRKANATLSRASIFSYSTNKLTGNRWISSMMKIIFERNGTISSK